MEWSIERFEDLSGLEVYRILQLRSQVFVVEQNCVYQDIDGIDLESTTLHVVGQLNGEIVAYGRVYGTDPVHLGRIVCSRKTRGQGVGRELLDQLVRCAKGLGSIVEISAQVYARKFYESAGFTAISTEYLEDGIPHIDMRLVATD